MQREEANKALRKRQASKQKVEEVASKQAKS
jgi:hypothetical protein